MALGLAAPLRTDTPSAALPRSDSRQHRTAVGVETPQISILIVNFCQWNNTARLVQQLGDSEAVRRGAADITILDNNSPDSPVVKSLKKSPGVSIVKAAQNLGFAKAVNLAAANSQGDWVLLLNPDITTEPGFLDKLLTTAQRYPIFDPKCGVIGLQMRNPDGTKQASAGSLPSFWRTLARLVLPRSRRKCSHQELTTRKRVPWATGGCLLVRRDCFEQLQGLDERYFLYYEDVDFCCRAAELGWNVWYEPNVKVTHHFPLHSRNVPAPLRLITRHALLTFARKHWKPWHVKCLNKIVATEARLRGVLSALTGDATSAICHEQLRLLVGDLEADRTVDVAARLRYAASFLQDIAAKNDQA
jgi:N-acetylglucosaminyl-diphospho-decaprenol L-rhamnosyltransferase